jgi:sugar-specific transcriptional regulator TrmB
MDKSILKEVGLSEREISAYIALIRLGSTTTGPLVKLSGVQNAKIYETLEKLMNKGLISYIIKGKIKHFQASNSNSLLNIFEEKKSKLNQIVKELNKLREKKEPEHEAKIYEGIKAIKSVFYELYDYIGKNSEYCVFPIGEQLNSKELIFFWSQILHKQKKMKIRIRTLPNKKLRNIFEKHYKNRPFTKIRYTNQNFPTGIFIFKDHILNVIWDEKPIAFLIKSKENYKRWMGFFNEQWRTVK